MKSTYLSGSQRHYARDDGSYKTYWAFGYSDPVLTARIWSMALMCNVGMEDEVTFSTFEYELDENNRAILDENGERKSKMRLYKVKSFVIEVEPCDK